MRGLNNALDSTRTCNLGRTGRQGTADRHENGHTLDPECRRHSRLETLRRQPHADRHGAIIAPAPSSCHSVLPPIRIARPPATPGHAVTCTHCIPFNNPNPLPLPIRPPRRRPPPPPLPPRQQRPGLMLDGEIQRIESNVSSSQAPHFVVTYCPTAAHYESRTAVGNTSNYLFFFFFFSGSGSSLTLATVIFPSARTPVTSTIAFLVMYSVSFVARLP